MRSCRGHLPCRGNAQRSPTWQPAAVLWNTGPGTQPVCGLAPWTSGDFGSAPAGLPWGSRVMKSGTGGRGTAARAASPSPGTTDPRLWGKEGLVVRNEALERAAWGCFEVPPRGGCRAPPSPAGGLREAVGRAPGTWDRAVLNAPSWSLLQRALGLAPFARCSEARLRGGFRPTLAAPLCGPGPVAEAWEPPASLPAGQV